MNKFIPFPLLSIVPGVGLERNECLPGWAKNESNVGRNTHKQIIDACQILLRTEAWYKYMPAGKCTKGIDSKANLSHSDESA